jgi:hypothetical protein
MDIAATESQTCAELRLLDVARWPGPAEAVRKAVDVARGRVVPEALSWSTRRARAELASLQPRTIIILTSRAYDQRLLPGRARVIVDYVDRLSDSYRDRASAPGTSLLGRFTWRLLAVAHLRFERREPVADLRIAAGLRDATLLGVEYAPIVATVATADPPVAPDHDVAFVGNLRYPPNIEAVRELDAIWPELLRRRPATTLLLAGADPDPVAVALAAHHGWTLLADFPDERQVYASTRIAVAPLPHASGIQTKVIDALRHAVPVVAYAPAAAGFEASAPLVVVDDRAGLIRSVVGLLDDEAARMDLGRASAAWVGACLAPEAWSWVLDPRRRARRPVPRDELRR